MPMTVACDDCGKIYNVPSAMAGKRVKCKACGAAFIIAAPLAPAQAINSDHRGWARFARILGVVSRIQPTVPILVALLIAAVAIGFLGGRLPSLWAGTLIGLPVVAALFGVCGTVRLVAEGTKSAGYYRFPWRDLGRYAVPLLLGALLGLLGAVLVMILIRSRNKGAFESGPFYNRLAGLLIRVLAIALMPLVVLTVSFAANAFPKPPPSDLERQAAEAVSSPDFGQHSPQFHPFTPRLPDSFDSPRAPTVADARKMKESERRLRGIASMVFTYRANAHKTPSSLGELFRYHPQDLYSPFDPAPKDSYIYLPQNITGQKDGHIIAYDLAELEALGSTQAITSDFKILKLSKDELFARDDIPH